MAAKTTEAWILKDGAQNIDSDHRSLGRPEINLRYEIIDFSNYSHKITFNVVEI